MEKNIIVDYTNIRVLNYRGFSVVRSTSYLFYGRIRTRFFQGEKDLEPCIRSILTRIRNPWFLNDLRCLWLNAWTTFIVPNGYN